MGFYYMTRDNQDLRKPCRYCKEPIRTNDKYYLSESENDGREKRFSIAHARCEWAQAESDVAEGRLEY